MLSNADYGSNIGMGGGGGGGFGASLIGQNEFFRQPSQSVDGFINPSSVIGGNNVGGNHNHHHHHNHGG
jgi:hypothetical protein